MALKLPPFPLNADPLSHAYKDWSIKLQSILTDPSSITWDQISKTGSNLTDLSIRLHSSLQGIEGGSTSHAYHAAEKGTAVLVGGTKTVNTAQALTGSVILLTSQIDGGTIGFLRVSARVNATSFTITSSSPLDTSTVGYIIIN
jgi:hypothetical protein